MRERERTGEYERIENSGGLWSSDDDDYHAGDEDDEDDAPAPVMAIEDVWALAVTAAGELRAIKDAIASAEAWDRVSDSFRAAPEDLDIDALDERLEMLEQKRSALEGEMRNRGWPPKGWGPPTATPVPPREPTPSTRSESKAQTRPIADHVLRAALSAEEYQHYQWLVAQMRQQDVAARLGISQKTVSKREAKLRARVDEVYRATFDRPYPWTPISRKQGGRRRKA